MSALVLGLLVAHLKLDICKILKPSRPFQLLAHVTNLNESPEVHGIIVQMPLDSVHKIDAHLVTDAVSPDKDVDG